MKIFLTFISTFAFIKAIQATDEVEQVQDKITPGEPIKVPIAEDLPSKLNDAEIEVDKTSELTFKKTTVMDLYESVDMNTKEILAGPFTSKKLQNISNIFLALYAIIPQLSLPEKHILRDPLVREMFGYNGQVAVTNLLPYYASQKYCIEKKKFFEAIDTNVLEEYDQKLVEFMAPYKKLEDSPALDSEVANFVHKNLSKHVNSLYVYFRNLKPEQIGAPIAQDLGLPSVVVERYLFFTSLTLFATELALTNSPIVVDLPDYICTHLGYEMYVDNQLDNAKLTGTKFLNHIKSLYSISGATTHSIVSAALIGVGTFVFASA